MEELEEALKAKLWKQVVVVEGEEQEVLSMDWKMRIQRSGL